jgi:carbon-monoxide dehydrogenase large subunit
LRPQRLRALFLRSPHAQAAILAIEKTEALANPGVAALHRRGNYRRQTQRRAVRLRRHGKGRQADEGTARPLLARGKVRHVGDRVAMVIADSVEAARNAAERIGVEYRSCWR